MKVEFLQNRLGGRLEPPVLLLHLVSKSFVRLHAAKQVKGAGFLIATLFLVESPGYPQTHATEDEVEVRIFVTEEPLVSSQAFAVVASDGPLQIIDLFV
ncbi:MAG: hypothetical protein KC800_00890 [Candidatus Eremiobacteraeota bacterium]|nr:hypothetical protein [Candidatus Eremiobacteraeota bacterium]